MSTCSLSINVQRLRLRRTAPSVSVKERTRSKGPPSKKLVLCTVVGGATKRTRTEDACFVGQLENCVWAGLARGLVAQSPENCDICPER